MNTLATFFTGIAMFFLGLFGHYEASAPVAPPQQAAVVVASSSTVTASVQVETQVSSIGEKLFERSIKVNLESCKSKDDSWLIEQCKMSTEAISMMDIPSLQEVGQGTNYFKDKNNVYIAVGGVETSYITVFKNVDVPTFVVVDNVLSITKDKNSLFLGGKKLENMDAKTFKILGDNKQYAVDNKKVYKIIYPLKDNASIQFEEVVGARPETFKP